MVSHGKFSCLIMICLTLLFGVIIYGCSKSTNPEPARSWKSLGAGFDGPIYALAEYDNMLIAAGGFTHAGGLLAGHIAAWDGNSWSDLGGGTNFPIHDLIVYNSVLIAAGEFSVAGGSEIYGIAAWDGNSWSAVGENTNGVQFNKLAVYNGDLIAFATASSPMSIRLIGGWDGSQWEPVAASLDGDVSDFMVFDDKLIAVGDFTSVNGVDADNIAAWDGSQWTPLGNGIPYDAAPAVTSHLGLITVLAMEIGFDDTWCMVSWAGDSWSQVCPMINGDVAALVIYAGKPVVAGRLIGIDDSFDGEIVVTMSGPSWVPMSDGLEGKVSIEDLAFFEGNLTAAGQFSTTQNPQYDYNVAVWSQ